MTEKPFPPLRYSIGRLFAVERYLGRKVAELLEEMQSETGISIVTLTALVAAGRIDKGHERLLALDQLAGALVGILPHAVALIEQHGVKTAAAAVGTSLGAYLPTVER